MLKPMSLPRNVLAAAALVFQEENRVGFWNCKLQRVRTVCADVCFWRGHKGTCRLLNRECGGAAYRGTAVKSSFAQHSRPAAGLDELLSVVNDRLGLQFGQLCRCIRRGVEPLEAYGRSELTARQVTGSLRKCLLGAAGNPNTQAEADNHQGDSGADACPDKC